MSTPDSIARRVLCVPELLDNILSFVFDTGVWRSQNAQLIYVNRLWNELATRHIWQACGYYEGSSYYDFVKLVLNSERFSQYTRRLKRISFDSRHSEHELQSLQANKRCIEECLSMIDFPRLSTVQVGSTDYDGDSFACKRALPFLRNTVRELLCCSSFTTPEFWEVATVSQIFLQN